MHPVGPEEKTTSLRPCQSNARTQETSRLCGAATTRLSDAHLHPDEFEIAKRDQRAVRSRPVTRRDPCCGVHSAWWIYAAPRRRSFRPLRVTDTCARSPGLRSAAKRIDRLRRPRSQNTAVDCDGSNRANSRHSHGMVICLEAALRNSIRMDHLGCKDDPPRYGIHT